ncbi:hypothetical protein DIPPA_55627 [Diplonema papillatum]|nr:hypothetical protein DIPPA_55627 [Diplonema papillatum]
MLVVWCCQRYTCATKGFAVDNRHVPVARVFKYLLTSTATRGCITSASKVLEGDDTHRKFQVTRVSVQRMGCPRCYLPQSSRLASAPVSVKRQQQLFYSATVPSSLMAYHLLCASFACYEVL